jgi:hypothetical protein
MPNLDDALLRELIDLSYDHACTRPVGDLVEVDGVIAAIDILAEPERATRWQTRLGVPLRERLIARASKSAVTMEQWLHPTVVAGLRARLSKPAPIPRAWIDEMVANERVRDAVRQMLSESLSSFIAKASATLSENKAAGSGGIRGALGWGARAAGSVLGGIGEEIQSRLQERGKDFVDGAVSNVQARIAERLKSDDTAKAIGKRRLAAFEKFLKTTEAEASKRAAKTPWADVDATAPLFAHHNLARAEVREALRAELTAVLDDLSKETLGSLLDELGLRAHLRAALHHHALPGLRDLAQTEAFEAWWVRAHATVSPAAAS